MLPEDIKAPDGEEKPSLLGDQPAAPVKEGDVDEEGNVISAANAERINQERGVDPDAPALPEWLNESQAVKTEEGEIDWQATAAKLEERRANAEAKLMERKNRAPDSYELEPTKHWQADEAMVEKFKEWDLSNEQANAVMAFLDSDEVAGQLDAKNTELEEQLLMTKKGFADSEEMGKFVSTIGRWAVKEYGAEMAKELFRTHQGVMFAESQMKAGQTSVRETGTVPATKTVAELKADLHKLMDSEEYRRLDDAAIEKARALSVEIAQSNAA